MEVNYVNRNCYNYKRFGYLAKNYRNKKRIGQERRLEYRGNKNNRQRLLDSRATRMVISLEFEGFKFKKIKRLIYVKNVNGSFNKEGPIEHTVKVNIYYQEHRERMECDFGSTCNNLKLELRLHLGKDLRKCKGLIRSGKA